MFKNYNKMTAVSMLNKIIEAIKYLNDPFYIENVVSFPLFFFIVSFTWCLAVYLHCYFLNTDQ